MFYLLLTCETESISKTVANEQCKINSNTLIARNSRNRKLVTRSNFNT